MRVSRIQAAENRETVINVASRLFRERGFDGIGLKDLMKGCRADPGRLLQAVRIQGRPGGAGVQAGDGERHAADGRPRLRQNPRIRLAR